MNDPKIPVCVVFVLAIVGFGEVLQHTPIEVIAVPPLLITFPPQIAPELVIEETELTGIIRFGWDFKKY